MSSNHYPRDYRVYKIVSYVAGGLVLALLLGLLLGFLVKFLWNETLADIFGISQITFWQAFGLFVLAKLFFGFGGGGGTGPDHHTGRKKGWRRRGKVADDSAAPVDDETFRRFWREEGREAYESFRQTRGQQTDDDPGEAR